MDGRRMVWVVALGLALSLAGGGRLRAAAEDVPAVVRAGVAEALAVRTLEVAYTVTYGGPRLADEQVRALAWQASPEQLEQRLEFNRRKITPVPNPAEMWVRRTAGGTLEVAQAMHMVGQFGGERRSLTTPAEYRSYITYGDGQRQDNATIATRVSMPWHDVLLAGDWWPSMVASLEQGVLQPRPVPAGVEPAGDELLAVGRDDDPAVTVYHLVREPMLRWVRAERYDQPTAPPSSAITVEYETVGDLTFPVRMRDEWYGYTEDGTPIVTRVDEIEVTSRAVNETLADDRFEWPVVPVGVPITDRRFDPPLQYNQPYEAYTYEELAEIAARRAGAAGGGAGAAAPVPPVVEVQPR